MHEAPEESEAQAETTPESKTDAPHEAPEDATDGEPASMDQALEHAAPVGEEQ